MKVLCLGGSYDGRWIEPIQELPRIALIKKLESGDFENEFYALIRLAGNSKIFSVYALDGLTGDDIMDALINAYSASNARQLALSPISG